MPFAAIVTCTNPIFILESSITLTIQRSSNCDTYQQPLRIKSGQLTYTRLAQYRHKQSLLESQRNQTEDRYEKPENLSKKKKLS